MNLAFDLTGGASATDDMTPIQFHPEALTERETEVHARAVAQSLIYRRAEADLLATIEQLDQMNLYRKFGRNSTHDYNVHELKLSEAISLNFINVARKTREVPELQVAIHRGNLTVSKARKIVPVINAQNQASWINKAQTLTQAELEREVAEAAPDVAARMDERARAKKGQRVELKFSWPIEMHKEFLRAQDLVSEKNRSSASIEDTLTLAVQALLTKIDPLQKAHRSKQRGNKREQKRRDLSTESVPSDHVDLGTEGIPSDQVDLSAGGVSSDHVDSSAHEILRPQVSSSMYGNPRPHINQTANPPIQNANSPQKPQQNQTTHRSLSRDRRQRVEDRYPQHSHRVLIPAEVRHKVNLRDGRKCQSRLSNGRKCLSTRFLVFHHIHEVAKGGGNTVENLITLCGNCHRHWHRQGAAIVPRDAKTHPG